MSGLDAAVQLGPGTYASAEALNLRDDSTRRLESFLNPQFSGSQADSQSNSPAGSRSESPVVGNAEPVLTGREVVDATNSNPETSGNLFARFGQFFGSIFSRSKTAVPKAATQAETPLTIALKNLIGSNPFPMDDQGLKQYTGDLGKSEVEAIVTTLNRAMTAYNEKHCTQNDAGTFTGTFNRNDGSPEFRVFVQPFLQKLLKEVSQENITDSSDLCADWERAAFECEGEVSQAPAQISALAAAKIKDLINRINNDNFPVNLREFLDEDFSQTEINRICAIVNRAVPVENTDFKSLTAAQKGEVISGLERLLPKRPGPWERMKQHNKGVEEFNQNIDTLVEKIKNPEPTGTSILNMSDEEICNSLSNFGQGSARLLVSETICQYRADGADKVAEKLLGLKRENRTILPSSYKKLAEWYVKPINT
ncbi:MAG: hypothetical protein FJZ62_04575, partial [Chlamydiae bacterium]|nr:hypothetical protein [Chlamydiota bacterium]